MASFFFFTFFVTIRRVLLEPLFFFLPSFSNIVYIANFAMVCIDGEFPKGVDSSFLKFKLCFGLDLRFLVIFIIIS